MIDKIIAIGGEPGTGKTELMRQMMRDFTLTPFNYGNLRGMYDEYKKVYFIGVYDGSIFDGTERLSIKANADFVKFLNYADGIVVFEGDRLFTHKTLSLDYPFIKVVLTASNDVKETRLQLKRNNLTQGFIQRKTSKLHNIIKAHPDVLILNNDGDNTENINIIKNYIR